MLKIVLVLLYVLNGEIKLEQKPMPDVETCMAKGQARIEEIMKDPGVDLGLFADCVPVLVTEARK